MVAHLLYGRRCSRTRKNRRYKMDRVEELNQYIQQLFDYWEGKNDDFEPIPIPKEVDDEMQRDSFY